MNKQALLQGMTQPEERLLFAKVLDQAAFSYKRHTPAFTDFLDMAKSGKFLEKLRSLSDLNVVAFGGTEDCERRMIGFAPDYMELEGKDFPICALRITKHKKMCIRDRHITVKHCGTTHRKMHSPCALNPKRQKRQAAQEMRIRNLSEKKEQKNLFM